MSQVAFLIEVTGDRCIEQAFRRSYWMSISKRSISRKTRWCFYRIKEDGGEPKRDGNVLVFDPGGRDMRRRISESARIKGKTNRNFM